MAKNFLQEGVKCPVVLGGAESATAGEIFVRGEMVGVAQESGSPGDTITLIREGVFLVTKKAGTAWTQGDALYWDSTPGELTKTATDGVYAGIAFADATSGATTGEISLAQNTPDADEASGAELMANKDATGGYVGRTGYAVNLPNDANTFTSTLSNTNTAARAYTTQDKDYTFADDADLAGKLDSSAIKGGEDSLVAGTVTIADASITANSRIMVARKALGGSTALGELMVTRSVGVSFTVTSLNPSNPALTETNDTCDIMYLVLY